MVSLQKNQYFEKKQPHNNIPQKPPYFSHTNFLHALGKFSNGLNIPNKFGSNNIPEITTPYQD
jgi:hypothetical protein